MANIKDVAQKTGLSIATISKYVNGKKIKPKNQILIDNAIAELNYRPNLVARGLKISKTMTIGILLPNLTSQFFPMVVTDLEKRLSKLGYNVIIANYNESSELEESKFYNLLSRSVDGIIVAPRSLPEKCILEAEQRGVPVIFFDRLVKGISVDAVVIDNYDILKKVAKRLIELGHKKIALLAPEYSIYAIKERIRGGTDAIREAGLKEELWLCGSDSASAYLVSKQKLEEEGPTAIIACSSSMTVGCLMACIERGKKIPDDVSLVGFDNYTISSLVEPHISMVYQPVSEISENICDQIISRIRSGKCGENKIYIAKATFKETPSIRLIKE